MPRAGLVQTDYAMTLPASSSLATATVAPPMQEADFDDVSFAPATEYAPARRFQTDDIAPTPPKPFVPPGQYQEPETFVTPDQYEDRDFSAPPPAMPATSSAMPPPAHFDDAAAPEFNPGTVGHTGDLRTDTALAALERLAPPVSAHMADAELHHPMVAEAEAPVSADPWDDPLPAWEYSHNEWPMLADKQKVSTASKLKWPLIGLVGAIALAVGIAAIYFLFIKPRRELPAAQPPLTVQPNMQQPATAPPAPTTPAPTASTNTAAPANPTSSANANKADASATASSAADGQWKNALQVMASPNENEANAEAERLKNAGIAAYVVRAELGSHGVWYRVRIGRFTSPEEAQRFTNEVRARAKAANISLKNLQVTGYDKP